MFEPKYTISNKLLSFTSKRILTPTPCKPETISPLQVSTYKSSALRMEFYPSQFQTTSRSFLIPIFCTQATRMQYRA